MTVYGVHTNAQGKSLRDLRDVWTVADRLGYGWVSATDHFPGSLAPRSHDAVVLHATIAQVTRRAVCGMLVYCTGFRHPAVLATAATTVDHLSGGRAAIGLGSGAVAADFEVYGFPYPSVGVRSDILEESVVCVGGLLHDEVVQFAGTHFQLAGARNAPRPVQERLPVWVGAAGERRGLRIAARWADGWNTAGPPDAFAHKRAVLREHCEAVGRDPDTIRCSANVLLGSDPLVLPDALRPVVATGTDEEVLDRMGQYVAAGADQVNLHLGVVERFGAATVDDEAPYPWDLDRLARLASALGLAEEPAP